MSFSGTRLFVQSKVDAWRALRLDDLQYWHRGEARLAILALAALVVVLLIGRSATNRLPGRHRLVVPAVLSSTRASYVSFLRHAPLVLFLLGLPFFAIAVADPFTALVSVTGNTPKWPHANVVSSSPLMPNANCESPISSISGWKSLIHS